MNTKNITRFGLLAIIMVAFMFTSCQKRDDVVDPIVPTTNKKINDLKIADSFDWATTATYNLTITGYAKSTAKIFSAENVLLHTVMLKKGTPVNVQMTIPTAEKSIRLEFLGEQTEIELTSGSFSITL